MEFRRCRHFLFLGETVFYQMEIKIGDVKRAYVSKDGDISIRNLVFKIRLYDPTSMTPDFDHDKWRVYSPYDIKIWMEPGMIVRFCLGLGFNVPEGFVLYLFTSGLYEESLDVEGMFITPGDTDEVVVQVTCLKSFYLRKYMHIASFLILPVINTTDTPRRIMYAASSNEHR